MKKIKFPRKEKNKYSFDDIKDTDIIGFERIVNRKVLRDFITQSRSDLYIPIRTSTWGHWGNLGNEKTKKESVIKLKEVSCQSIKFYYFESEAELYYWIAQGYSLNIVS